MSIQKIKCFFGWHSKERILFVDHGNGDVTNSFICECGFTEAFKLIAESISKTEWVITKIKIDPYKD